MKTFIVCCEPYSCFGGQEPLVLEAYKAKNLDELIKTIEAGTYPNKEELEEWDLDPLSPTEWLLQANGDGMSYYVIKELLPDGTLGPSLID